MNTTLSPSDFERVKGEVEGFAVDAMASYLKAQFLEALFCDTVFPQDMRAAFKLDSKELIRRACEKALKEIDI